MIIKITKIIPSVDATDSDGTIIEVRFFIDGVAKGSTISSPYNYAWETNSESVGNHTIKATSVDNEGRSNSDEISVDIVLGSEGVPCPGIPTFTYHGHTYNTVLIGNQCWMKENLNYQPGNSWCYDNNYSNCNTYGRLYDWKTALNVCPTGWHLPGDDEWKILEGNVDSQYGVGHNEWDFAGYRGFDAGKKLKTISGWNNYGNGTDDYGFSVLPGGYRNYDGTFSNLGYNAYFWSSTEGWCYGSWHRGPSYNGDKVNRYDNYKSYGFSVRCVKD